jgi:3-oxoacyl-[acyl-carrier-protein] synthase-3
MRAYIRSVGAYVPEKVMTNDDLARIVDTNDEWIFSHTGIRERRIAAEGEAASDLAREAVLKTLSNAVIQDAAGGDISAADIDLILLATSTPDYPGLPSTACVVQDMIGAGSAGAMDLVAACTGFIYALETARNYVLSGAAENVLVIGSEVYSRIVNWEDRSTCVLFGDGAGAALVSAADEDNGDSSGVYGSYLRSRGSGVEHLLRPDGGSRNKADSDNPAGQYLYMNGRQVYLFAVGAITETINSLLENHGLTMDDIDHVVPHQANRRIIEAACKRNDWPVEKFFMNIDKYANTSAASIPLAMDEMMKNGLLKRGDRILTVGFGSGLTYGGNYFIW